MTPLPLELTKRIQMEATENDAFYSRKSEDSLDLSALHYGHAEMLDWSLKRMPSLKGARILDVGVGDGYSSVIMARAGALVTGIDVSDVALQRAAELAKRNKVRVELRQMPGEDLGFETQSFDAILSVSAFHHMDHKRAASEFARVLRPGGRLVMIDPLVSNPPAWLYRKLGHFFSREATSEERPLRVRDLAVLRQNFHKVTWTGMFLFSVALFGVDRICHASPRVQALTAAVFKAVSPLDKTLLRLPILPRIAWKIAVVAER